MFKKIIFGLSLWLFATTLSFGANFDDGLNPDYAIGKFQSKQTYYKI